MSRQDEEHLPGSDLQIEQVPLPFRYCLVVEMQETAVLMIVIQALEAFRVVDSVVQLLHRARPVLIGRKPSIWRPCLAGDSSCFHGRLAS